MVELMTTDSLSPNIYVLVMMGTPRYPSVFLRSIICSVAALAATNSEPYVAVSTGLSFREPVCWGGVDKVQYSCD